MINEQEAHHQRSLATALALLALAHVGLAFSTPADAQTVDSLPSWNDGKAKQSIIAFVATGDEGRLPRLRATR